MQAWADRNLESLVENTADLGRRKSVGAETDRADAAAVIAMTERHVAAHLVQFFPEALDEPDFVRVNFFDALLLDPFNPGNEAGDAQDIGRPAFEEIWI